MSRGINISVGKTYTTPGGSFVTIEKLALGRLQVDVKGYDTALSRWVSWSVQFQTMCAALHSGALKSRKKPANNEVGLGVAALPTPLRPGPEAAVCL